MRFSLTQQALLGPLLLVSGAVEKRQTLPVLSNILVQVENGSLTLTGTDLEVEMIAKLNLGEGALDGDITVPAKKLVDIVKSFASDTVVTFELKDSKVKVSGGKSRFTLSTLPSSEFPSLEDSTDLVDVELSVSDLKVLIESTQFAMAQQDVRYYLNGMLFEFDESKEINAVATDGHRLALTTSRFNSDIGSKQQAVVPRKGVLELSRFLSSVDEAIRLQISNNHIKASSEHFAFTSKLVDGKYPDYQKVLPKGGDKLAVADRALLKEALQKASILCNEKFKGVRFNLGNNLISIHSNNPEQEEAEIEIDVDYGGPDLEIGFNVTYMLDVLNTAKSDYIKLTFSDSNSSLLVEEVDGGTSVYVIMPMRL